MKKIFAVLLLVFLLSGCNREPVYRGLSFVTFNYTPWIIDTVNVRDHEGHGGGAGTVTPGAGEGSVVCCGSLHGTDFEVTWTGIDYDVARKHLFDGKLSDFIFKKTTRVYFPPTKIPSGNGPLIFEVHIYPDEHIEFALTRNLLGDTRIPIVDVSDWMMRTFGDQLNPDKDPYAKHYVLRKVAHVIADAWMKYRLVDEQDLRQYAYLSMMVNSKFDQLPEFEKILKDKARKPGDFARFVQRLPTEAIADVKTNRFDLKETHE